MMPAQLLLGAEVQSLSQDLQFHPLHASSKTRCSLSLGLGVVVFDIDAPQSSALSSHLVYLVTRCESLHYCWLLQHLWPGLRAALIFE